MSVFRKARMAVVVAAALACDSDSVFAPIKHFEYSAATFQCGPADGPATAIFLSHDAVGSVAPSAPFVRIYVPVAVEQLSGDVWQLSEGSADGTAWFHSSDASSEVATSGYMIVAAVGSERTVQGSVYLEFPNAGRVSGAFAAAWIPRTIMCG
jgi:hypothetical protein